MAIDKEKLRERIGSKRKELGITQAELASRAGVTPAAISQIESGARIPMLPVLQQIAKALVVSLDYLAGQSDSTDVSSPAKGNEAQAFFREFQQLSMRDQELIKKNIEFLKNKP